MSLRADAFSKFAKETEKTIVTVDIENQKPISHSFLLRRRQDFDKQTLIRLYWR